MTKSKKWLLLIVALVIVLVAGRYLYRAYYASGIEVTIGKAEKRTIVESVSASGKLKPIKEVKISSEVSGEILEMNLREGQKVKKGDLLLKINPDIYEAAENRASANVNNAKANLQNAKAQLVQSQAQFENAKKNYERHVNLLEKKAISQAEFDQVEADFNMNKANVTAAEQSVEAARFNVSSSEANLKEARDNLRRTEIYAPIDGIISKIDAEQGERVVGTMQMQGTEILRLADFGEMEVAVEVNENDIIRLNYNDTAIVEVDAFPKTKFVGFVSRISNSPDKDDELAGDQITNFLVKVQLLRSSYSSLIPENAVIPSPFRPGMSAIVDIQTQKKEGVVCVPLLSVTTRVMPEESKETEVVFIYDEATQTVKTQPITTGIQDDRFIEVVDGLDDGESIVVGNYATISRILNDGMEVEPAEEGAQKGRRSPKS